MKHTNILEQLLIGSMLGDGYLCKIDDKYKKSRLSIAHSPKQKEYIEFKLAILRKNNLAGKLSFNRIFNKRYKKGYFDEYRFKSLSSDYFNRWRNSFYKNGNKSLDFNIINNINILGLVIWFIDDGFKCTRSYEICTNSFTIDECNKLRELLLNKFNIETTLQKTENIIYIKTISKELFENLIYKYVIKFAPNKLHGSCINRMNCKNAEMPTCSLAIDHSIEGSETTGEKMDSLNNQN